jgi:acyl-CoA synthetase (AMP-forming)/AMP-acid ligase II
VANAHRRALLRTKSHVRGAAPARGGTARRLRECGARSLAFLDLNGPAAAVALYGAARAEVPHVPLNYRLSRGEIESLLRRLDEPLIVAAPSQLEGLRCRQTRS